MNLIISSFLCFALPLQAIADTAVDLENALHKTHPPVQRRADAISRAGPLIRPTSNDTSMCAILTTKPTPTPLKLTYLTSIHLTIVLTASPSTNLTILHFPRAQTALIPSTPKRSTSPIPSFTHRIICPRTDFTISSDCNKRFSSSERSWRRFCYPDRPLPPGVPYDVEFGACAKSEICMDGLARNEGRHYAVCVDLGGSMPLGGGDTGPGGEAEAEADRDGKREVITTYQSTMEVGRGKELGVKVFLMEDDGATAVLAESLSLKAWVGRDGQQGSVLQKPRSLSQRCRDCAEVGLKNVPANTPSLRVDGRLGKDTKDLKMYVVAVEL